MNGVEMCDNSAENAIQLKRAQEQYPGVEFKDYLIGALLNYVAPEDFKNCTQTAIDLCRGWSEHSRIAHIYGAENV